MQLRVYARWKDDESGREKERRVELEDAHIQKGQLRVRRGT